MMRNLKLPYGRIQLIEQIEDGHFESASGCFEHLPRMCRVVVDASAGEGSQICVEVWMPEEWNGIFIGHGNGGVAGKVMHHNLEPFVSRGYAVAQSDLGSADGLVRGQDNPDVWEDFGGRANLVMTKIGKAVVSDYYGRTPNYAYFLGSSTGGQQAYSVAQRYPEEYDGIIGGVPANNLVFIEAYKTWNYRAVCPNGEPLFTKEDISRITECGVAFFQNKGDGEKGDDFISHPYFGEETTEAFLEYLQKEEPRLQPAQIEALRAVYQGPTNPTTGEQIYCGVPIGSEFFGGSMLCPDKKKNPAGLFICWTFGKDYDGFRFDFDKDMERMATKLGKILNANDPDLSAFQAHGGKFITFSGTADPIVPYPEAVKYYNRVCQKMGGYDKVKEFYRYFLFPGKDHGDNGKGVNAIWADEEGHQILDALRRWREEGIAPEYMISAHVEDKKELRIPCVGLDADMAKASSQITFTRKIYPYKADWLEGKDFPACCADRYLEF